MKVLGGNQPVVEIGFEPIEELPGYGGVALRVGDGAVEEMGGLFGGEDTQVGRGVALHQRDGAHGLPDRLSRHRCTRPSSSRSHAPALAATTPAAGAAATEIGRASCRERGE